MRVLLITANTDTMTMPTLPLGAGSVWLLQLEMRQRGGLAQPDV